MTSPEFSGEQPVDYDHFLDKYGLGPHEIDTVMSFNGHTGTLGSILDDERCPVGGIFANAYSENGLSGIETKITGLKMIYGADLPLDISKGTRDFHEGTTSREQLLQQPRQETTDFLALPPTKP